MAEMLNKNGLGENRRKKMISVIIPTYNRCQILMNALESVLDQELDSELYEIIVVDNASTDETRQRVEELNSKSPKRIRYIYESRPGLHWARHAGARAARGEILVYTDDDAEVTRNWLNSLAIAYREKDVAAAGGPITVKWIVEPPKGLPCSSTFGQLDLGPKQRPLQWPEVIYGGNFSIKKGILFQVGGFNPDTAVEDRLVGDGEIGLCRKLYARQMRICYVPGALVYHVQNGAGIDLNVMKHRYAQQGRAAAYSDFKYDGGSFLKAFRGMFKAILLGLKFEIGARFIYREAPIPDFYRCEVHSALEFAKAKYHCRLIINRRFRRVVLRQDWISEDVKGQ